jgi:hypothetical protein
MVSGVYACFWQLTCPQKGSPALYVKKVKKQTICDLLEECDSKNSIPRIVQKPHPKYFTLENSNFPPIIICW